MKIKALATFCFILACGWLVVHAQQQAAKAAIDGIVVSTVDGSAIPGARVTVSAGNGNPRPAILDQLFSAIASEGAADFNSRIPGAGPVFGRGRSLPSTTTGVDGTFSLELDPGMYRVIADADGYVPAEFGQRAFVGLGTPIVLDSGQTTRALRLRMTPTGVVTGRITDTKGMPAEQVPVAALRVSYTKLGQRLLEIGAVGMTDDRGEYRLYGITPGRYFLKAGSNVVADAANLALGRVLLEGLDPQSVPRQQSLTQIYALTYYPGVTDGTRAGQIDVKSGDESRVNLIVTRDVRHRVGGRVIDSRTGRPPQETSISLIYYTTSGGTESSSTRINPESGAFSFQNVIPGPYTIRAQGRIAAPAGLRGADSLAAQLAAQVTAEMAVPTASLKVNVNGDIENLVLEMSTPAPLDGQLTINGEPPSTLPQFDRLRPSLRQFVDGGLNPSGPSVQVAADGTFHFDGIREDDYKFSMTGLPLGFYVEKAESTEATCLREFCTFRLRCRAS